MKYRAQITLDWGEPHSPNDQQAILAALVKTGWCLAETTALVIETDDLNRIWQGIEVVAKGADAAGTLTALSFNVVASDDFGKSRPYPALGNHPKALDKLSALPYPRPK